MPIIRSDDESDPTTNAPANVPSDTNDVSVVTLVGAVVAIAVVFVSVRKIHATLFLPRTIESVKKVLKNLSPLLK